MPPLQERLEEINENIEKNFRYLIETYTESINEAVAEHLRLLEKQQKDSFETVQKEIASTLRILKGIETVIRHNQQLHHTKKETHQ